MKWLGDYGTFIAASIAAIVTIANAVWQNKRGDAQWLRDLRLPRYAAFLRAARDYRNQLAWHFAEFDFDIVVRTPPEEERVNVELAQQAFDNELADVTLVGPAPVVAAAQRVQFAVWRYRDVLESDPSRYSTRLSSAELRHFVISAMNALGVPGNVSSDLEHNPHDRYREWLEEVGERVPRTPY